MLPSNPEPGTGDIQPETGNPRFPLEEMSMRALALLVLLASAAPLHAQGGERPPSPEEIAWTDFCQRLEQVGHDVLRGIDAVHSEDRGEGLRYLADQLAVSIRQVIVAREVAFPLFRVGSTYKLGRWGMDAADAKYQTARLEGHGRYRISGRIGSPRLVSMQLVSFGKRFQAFDAILGPDLQADPDGRFELFVTPDQPEGTESPWLRLHPATTDLIVREYFGDWEREEPSELRIERLDEAGPTPLLAPEEGAAFLARVAGAFAGRAGAWVANSSRLRRDFANRFAPVDRGQDQGLADNVYGSGWWTLAPDEALVIELEPPAARLWSFQLGNLWSESVDYVMHSGSLNSEQAFVSSDGKVRIVIAPTDPGIPNWLDTAGHHEGQMLYRYQSTEDSPVPTTRVVKSSELAAALPPDTPARGPSDRARERAERSRHAAKRWEP
jgi:hypothetical protein